MGVACVAMGGSTRAAPGGFAWWNLAVVEAAGGHFKNGGLRKESLRRPAERAQSAHGFPEKHGWVSRHETT